jgi:hypothetical protein
MAVSLQEVGMQRMQGAEKEHYNEGPVKPIFEKILFQGTFRNSFKADTNH